MARRISRLCGWLGLQLALAFVFVAVGAVVAASLFEAQSWQQRLSAAGLGALFALVVALALAPLIAAPVDRLILAARARGAGRRDVRVGRIRGLRDMQQLAATFDEMAGNLDHQDQLRRDFVATLVHELRAPIAVLQASTEALQDHIAEPTDDQLASLNDEAVRLARMVDDLQRLASAEAAAVHLEFAPSDLADLAADVADSMADIFDRAGIRLQRRLSAVRVQCDRPRMREVITNLLTNAVKFTQAGGVVVLQTRSSGATARLLVTDSGVGIAPEDLPLVSRRFYRGRGTAQVSGSGIGLAIVAELVRGHHGRLDIASAPGEGTQVTVELPAADAAGRRPDGPARRDQ